MRAIVQERFGSPDVLAVRDVDVPSVGPHDVRVRVQAASLHRGDAHVMRGQPYPIRLTGLGLLRPKRTIPGSDVAGRIDAVGDRVTRFAVGDAVFGWCAGALAEYACAHEDNFVPKPVGLTFGEAAAVPVSAFAALQGLRGGRIEAGQRVLVIGASGGVGTFAVQLAKVFETEVTGVCGPGNVELVRSLGADHVIDHTQEDFARNGRRYDLILDAVGHRSLATCRRALTPSGTCVLVGAPTGRWLKGLGRPVAALVLSRMVRQELRPLMAKENRADLVALVRLLEAERLSPVVGRRFDLTETTAAFRHLETGHAQGKLVVAISGER
jgi:NADPH:quinone reductase-like Zn-dependent oxidoreductase